MRGTTFAVAATVAAFAASVASGKIYKHDDSEGFEAVLRSGGKSRRFLGASAGAVPEQRLLRNRHGVRVLPAEGQRCDYFPEVVIVQDISSSFEDDMVNMRRLIPQMFEFFEKRFENKARLGLVSFVDKYAGYDSAGKVIFGHNGDFCAKLDFPLASLETEENREKAKTIYSNFVIGGGGDYFDSANEAVLRAAVSSAVGWSEDEYDAETNRPIIRLMIVATDAGVHEADYAVDQEVASGRLPAKLPANDVIGRNANSANLSEGCEGEDYPTTAQLGEALTRRNIIPIVFAGRPSYFDAGTNKYWFWKQFTNDVVKRFGMEKTPWDDIVTGLQAFYGDYFKEEVGRDTVVQYLSEDSDNFMEILEKAIGDVDDLICLSPPPPVTDDTDDGNDDNQSGGDDNGDDNGNDDNQSGGGDDNGNGGDDNQSGGGDDNGNGDDNQSGGGDDNNGGGDDNPSGGGDDNNGGGDDDNQTGGGDENGNGGDDNQSGGGDDNGNDDNGNGGGDDNQSGGDDNQSGGGDDNNSGGDDNNNGGGDDNQSGGGDDNNNGGGGDDNQSGGGDDNNGGGNDDNQTGGGDDNGNGSDDDNQTGGDDNGNGDDEPTDAPRDTTTTSDDGGGVSTAVIASAAGGSVAAAAAAAGVLKKMGVLFNSSPDIPTQDVMDVDNVDQPGNREQFEEVTGDLFA